MGRLPKALMHALRPVTVVTGHYGAGKTNLCMNLAVDAAASGLAVTVVDLDIVNPYFRASEQRALLEQHGIRLVAPVFAEAGTSLDVPSLTGQIAPAIESAGEGSLTLIDAGGDDAGATALGRYARAIAERPHAVLYVANRFRNLVANPHDALENLREVEAAARLHATGIVNNSHLKSATDTAAIEEGAAYAAELAALAGLPLICTTTPSNLAPELGEELYSVQTYVKNPWE